MIKQKRITLNTQQLLQNSSFMSIQFVTVMTKHC